MAMARLIRGAMLVSVLCTMPAVLGQVPELEGQPDPASLAHGSTEWQVLDQPVSMMKLGTSGGAIDFKVGPRSASGSEGLPGGRVQVLGWRSAPQYKFFPWQARCSFAARAARVRRSPIPGAAGLPAAWRRRAPSPHAALSLSANPPHRPRRLRSVPVPPLPQKKNQWKLKKI